VAGRRLLGVYVAASHFQWEDANCTGSPLQLGHRPLAGVAAFLVRSVTNERLLGRKEQRARRGYDYKLPHFDMVTRTGTGFAQRSSFALDPALDDPAAAARVGASLVQTQRNAQRPNGLPGLTHARASVAASGAPASEVLTSYVESLPTTLTGTANGLQAVFSAPSRVFSVDYP